ncbi:P2Y purinoceptor 1-like [Corythoichthys intestinalis]|uniref:P2Y purinoceptor 1-like n=1 Tax=Corythoichthys intestinalis TaxID=161448 RepID=UPI0025A6349E|nr:P2Y purinoceptor 1-like [Corythoichthys intestinalis]XP_061813616.1 P2Y purinoceptor 1-like [Nerophis lumbriciformis]
MFGHFTRQGFNNTPGANSSACDINLNFTHGFLPPAFIVVFVVGTLANIWGLRSVCSGWNSKGNINIFMLNLGLADLLYLFTLPFLVAYYAQNSYWQFGQPFCKLTRFCFNLNLYGSIGFLTCISIYRYLGIVHPMRVMGRITSHHSLVISALVWALVILQITPDMFFDKNDAKNPNACYDTTADEWIREYLPYSVGWTVIGFAIPLVVIVLCYSHILWVVAKNSNVNPLLKQRSLRLVVILILLFAICFIPYHMLRNVNLKTRILKQKGICRDSFRNVYIAHQISRFLACLNSAINPLIYIVGNEDFLLKLQRLSERARMSLANLTHMVMYRKTSNMDTDSATCS